MSQLLHANVHREWSNWSEQERLHVIGGYFNPFRFRRRRELFNEFARQMQQSPNVVFWPVEVAFGARPFEVTEAGHPQHVQLRTSDVMWFKENAIDIGVQRIPVTEKYLAYVDGDVTFSRYDWALEAIHLLQHYHFVQLFSSFTFNYLDHRPTHQHPGYAYIYCEYPPAPGDLHGGNAYRKQVVVRTYRDGYNPDPPKPPKPIRNLNWPGAPGLGWAFTRTGFNLVGGMMDKCILGSADWHMALGLTGDEARGASVKDGHGTGDAYNNEIGRWQRQAYSEIKGKIGYLQNLLIHHWHGDHGNRQYSTRWEILDRNQFDPSVDVMYDSQGLLRWKGNKPQLERDVYRYFIQRDDDSTEMAKKPLL